MLTWVLVGTLGFAFLWIGQLRQDLKNVEFELTTYLRRLKTTRDLSDAALRVHFNAQVRTLESLVLKYFTIGE